MFTKQIILSSGHLWNEACVPSLQMALGSESSCLRRVVAEEEVRKRIRRWEGGILMSTNAAANTQI